MRLTFPVTIELKPDEVENLRATDNIESYYEYLAALWDGHDHYGLFFKNDQSPLTDGGWESFLEAISKAIPPPNKEGGH